MKIGICSDHAGFEYKSKLIPYIEKMGYEVEDFGTHSTESMDYPDVAHPLAIAVESGKVDCGIAMCGTGNGMAMTLNKHQGVRAGLAWCKDIAQLIRQHNDANMIAFAGRFMKVEEVLPRVDLFLSTPFEGGRHVTRVEKISALEKQD